MLPLENHVRQFAKAAKISPLQIALQGGEDYQLLCTTSPKYVDTVIKKIQQTTGTAMTSIGTIVKKSQGKTMVLSDGKILPLTSQGYDHLA
jgi:thiamine-monophosphate kinase